MTPLPRLTRPVVLLAAAAVAATSLGWLGLHGNADGLPAPVPVPAPMVVAAAPEPHSSAASFGPVPEGLLLEDEPGQYVVPGERVRLNGGGSAIIDGDKLRVRIGGEISRVDLGEVSGAVRLAPWAVELGRAGAGYLVDDGDGEWSRLRLYVPDGNGNLVRAEVTGGVPFGAGMTEDGAGYTTRTSDEGARLHTRVMTGDVSQGRYRVYRWSAQGPASAVRLVPTDLGTICFDFEAAAYERC